MEKVRNFKRGEGSQPKRYELTRREGGVRRPKSAIADLGILKAPLMLLGYSGFTAVLEYCTVLHLL